MPKKKTEQLDWTQFYPHAVLKDIARKEYESANISKKMNQVVLQEESITTTGDIMATLTLTLPDNRKFTSSRPAHPNPLDQLAVDILVLLGTEFRADEKLQALPETFKAHMSNYFEILNKLGEGGFGSVYLAKHRIDKQQYAIKCLPLDDNEKVKSEAEVFSKLTPHCNVVRYHTCWVEERAIGTSKFATSDASFTSTEASVSNASTEKFLSAPIAPMEKFGIASTASLKDVWAVPTTATASMDKSSSARTASTEEFSGASAALTGVRDVPSAASTANEGTLRRFTPARYLYIQMEYCQGSSLDKFLLENLVCNRQTIIEQIVAGLVHIHKEGTVHRDLKTDNIFVGANNQIKLGDLGLAYNMDMNNNPVKTGASRFKPRAYTNTVCDDSMALAMVIIDVMCTTKIEASKSCDALKISVVPDILEKHSSVFKKSMLSLADHNPISAKQFQEATQQPGFFSGFVEDKVQN